MESSLSVANREFFEADVAGLPDRMFVSIVSNMAPSGRDDPKKHPVDYPRASSGCQFWFCYQGRRQFCTACCDTTIGFIS